MLGYVFTNPAGLYVKRPDGRHFVRIGSGDACGAAWEPLAQR